MYKNLILSILIIIFLSACKESQKPLPEGILTKVQMIKVLSELHLMEASINEENINYDIKHKYNVVQFDLLFKKLEIRKTSFDSSMVFYRKNLNLYKEIHDSVYYNLDQMIIMLEAKAEDFEK